MPARARRCAGARVMSLPWNSILPPVGCMTPISVLSRVVFPMPLWPRMPTNSPSVIEKVSPVRTGIEPYPERRLSTRIMSAPSRPAEIDLAHRGVGGDAVEAVFHEDTALMEDRHG